MDPPPAVHSALIRLLLQVGVNGDLRRPRLGVRGARAEEVEPSPPSHAELLRLLVRLPVPHVARLLPPRAASPPTTARTGTAPSLVDLLGLLAVHRLRLTLDRPMKIVASALLRTMYHIAVDDQAVRAASAIPAARTAIARSLFNRFAYLVLRRVRRLLPP